MRPPTRSRVGPGFVVLCALFGCARENLDAPGNASSPAVRLLDLDGRPVNIFDPDAAATVVLFTRSDCPISNQYAPEVRSLCDRFGRRGARFYLVYVDPRERPEDIRRHVREFGYPCPAVRDPAHALVTRCGATTTPEAVVFGRDRSIIYQGRIDDLYADLGRPRSDPTTHDLSDAIDAVLSGRPVPVPRTHAVGCPIADLKE